MYNSPKHRGALDCLPFQGLRDDLEYKFLGCIQDHHQLRIAICGESACVFITAGPITKLFAGGGGGEWTTCAMIDDEPRPVWMSPLITH